MPLAVRGVMAALGFQYLKLRTFAANPGALEPVQADAQMADQSNPDQLSAQVPLGELVHATATTD